MVMLLKRICFLTRNMHRDPCMARMPAEHSLSSSVRISAAVKLSPRHCKLRRMEPTRSINNKVSTAHHIQVLDARSASTILDGLDTLVADCDGVLWRGSQTIPNAPEALLTLRQRGKRLLFVTNNSSKSREQYVAKFDTLGISVEPREVSHRRTGTQRRCDADISHTFYLYV